jgi:hypothetical protein
LVFLNFPDNVRGAATPAGEPFGTRLETLYIALSLAPGDIDGKPF